MSEITLWDRFKRYYIDCPSIGLSLDVSRMGFDEPFLTEMQGPITEAFQEMEALEKGAIANPDESRMVGHYWLRAPELSPTEEIRNVITQTVADVKSFAADVHGGAITAPGGRRFTDLLIVGIGGSALGPQFVSHALGGVADRIRISFCDNTDPDGIDRTIDRIGSALPATMTVVISKSGGTAETRNGMLEVRNAYQQAGLDFSRFAVAITGAGSALDSTAKSEGWVKRFPMWDWVGGRTSEMSAVGLLPAALQGIDIDEMLAGAAACDAITRVGKPLNNPAAMLALMWFYAGDGHGSKDMVVLPYKDRLSLLARYLQQLVMESLGKKLDRSGRVVHQGITVYGNKGSTDQHAYVQQLRDGLSSFFATFIGVTRDREGPSIDVDENVTSGDFLHGFLLGTRQALHEAGRESITLTITEVSPRSVGILIALFERAVGFYASLIDVNAYHQPGVEAGKKAASDVIDIQRAVLSCMRDKAGDRRTAEEWAQSIDRDTEAETVFKTLEHLAANTSNSVTAEAGDTPFDTRYGVQ